MLSPSMVEIWQSSHDRVIVEVLNDAAMTGYWKEEPCQCFALLGPSTNRTEVYRRTVNKMSVLSHQEAPQDTTLQALQFWSEVFPNDRTYLP